MTQQHMGLLSTYSTDLMTNEIKSLYVLESTLKRIPKISIYTYLMKFSGIFKHRLADQQQ